MRRIVSGFLIGLPIAVAGGAPISTALLGLDGVCGLHGWQIMYIAEGVPTVLIGILTFFVLTDRPEQANFLTAEEKTWLSNKLLSERRAKEAVRTFSLWQGMFDPKVLLLALNYFGIVVASLGVLFFVPQIIKSLGVTEQHDGRLADHDPLYLRRHRPGRLGPISDRMNERRWNLLGACVVSTIGLVIAGMTMGSWWAMVGLSIATFGFYGSKGPFWAMPPMFLTGTAAAASIAWINSIGNLGGFFGPWYVGVVKDLTDSYAGGLYGLAFLCLISAFVCAFFLHIPILFAPGHNWPSRRQTSRSVALKRQLCCPIIHGQRPGLSVRLLGRDVHHARPEQRDGGGLCRQSRHPRDRAAHVRHRGRLLSDADAWCVPVSAPRW